MIPYDPDKPDGPTPEEWAAYADGELDVAAARDVAAWLRHHPEASGSVAEQKQLARLWAASAPPEPAPDQWSQLFERVVASLPVQRMPPARKRGWLAWLAPVAAAAVLAILLLNRTQGPVDMPRGHDDEPLPMATDDDVKIITMDDRDRSALVVGRPPFREPLALLGPDEVTVDQLEGDDNGVPPRYSSGKDYTPMVVTPMRSELLKQP